MKTNILTVDLEDWCHSLYLQGKAVHFDEKRIEKNTLRLCSLFDSARVQATFFVLAEIAERMPELIRLIHSKGHEIASHGYNHRLLHTMSPAEVCADIEKSCNIIEKVTQCRVHGYRSPAWSMPTHPSVLFDCLESLGIEYDSSCAPISVPGIWCPTGEKAVPYVIPQRTIVEIPPTTLAVGWGRIPVAGGVALRLYPYALTRSCVRMLNARGQHAVVYVHPWDLDTEFTPVPLRWPYHMFHYTGRHTVEEKLRQLCDDCSFTTMYQFVQTLTPDKG